VQPHAALLRRREQQPQHRDVPGRWLLAPALRRRRLLLHRTAVEGRRGKRGEQMPGHCEGNVGGAVRPARVVRPCDAGGGVVTAAVTVAAQ
jgi:hypothetical protein